MTSEYTYDRTGYDGKGILRKDTHEPDKYVSEVLNDRKIQFEYKNDEYHFVIYREDTKTQYQYYFTTGRWGVFKKGKRKPEKYYRSNGIEDFLDRFFNK